MTINWRDPKKELPDEGQRVWAYAETASSMLGINLEIFHKDYFYFDAWVPYAEINLPEFEGEE